MLLGQSIFNYSAFYTIMSKGSFSPGCRSPWHPAYNITQPSVACASSDPGKKPCHATDIKLYAQEHFLAEIQQHFRQSASIEMLECHLVVIYNCV